VNESGQIVGQLYGKCYSGSFDNCIFSTYNGIWGKFSASYTNNNLAFWLNNGGASVSMTNSPASSLSFGTVNVGVSSTLNITITNSGTVPNFMNLEAGAVTISGTNAADFSIVGATSLYLSPGQSGTIAVKFTPSSAGAKTASLSIPHNANNNASPRTISLSGTGVSVCKTCPDYDAVITPVEAWATVSATIPEGGCKIYRLTVTDGMTYTFQTGCANGATADFDTYLALHSNVCPVVISNDDGCESYRSRIIWVANYSGYAYLKVSGYQNAGGSYTLAYRVQPPVQTPCSNVIPITGTGANNTNFFLSMGSGLWSSNNITCDTYCYGSEQVYSFTPTVSGWYRVRVPFANGLIPLVSFMWRANECFIENWEAWSCFGTLNLGETSQAYYWTAGTTYYIALDAVEWDPDLFQDLTFYLDYSSHCPDPDHTIIAGNAWQVHSSYTNMNDVVRVYQFDVQAGDTYQFKTGCGDGASATFLTDLKLEDSECALVVAGNNTVCPDRSHLEWTADSTETLFLKVTGQLVYGSSGYYYDYGNFTLAYRVILNGIPNQLTLQNGSVTSGNYECYDAFETIVVAGGGTTYTVSAGGESTLIAGVSISMLPGTTVQSGGRLLATITPDGTFCPGPTNPLTPDETFQSASMPVLHEAKAMSIRPNPVSDVVTLALGQREALDCRVQIFSASGAYVMKQEFAGSSEYNIDVSKLPRGIFILKVISKDEVMSVKMIKQ
jgi:hypothetical protein